MKNKEIIHSSLPFFDDEIIHSTLRDIEAILKTGILSSGPYVRDFENEFANYVQTKHAISVNSGTAALEIVLRYFKLRGREVIVPTNTFVATPNSVALAGGKPVFADISKDTLCIDPEDIERKLTPKTAGVIAVHIAGLICPEIDKIANICEDNGLFLLEDDAHAHGASIDGKMAGALGDAGCFSFYPTKVMTTGEGGMITTNIDELAETARCMRTHGLNSERLMIMMGNNWRLSEIAAAVGKRQLQHLNEFVDKRNVIAKCYSSALSGLPEISLFQTPPRIRHSYYKYPLLLGENVNPQKIATLLKQEYGIETGNVYYPPCHLNPFYVENFGTKEGDLPVSEKILKRVLCLPMHSGLTETTAKYVTEALIRCLGE